MPAESTKVFLGDFWTNGTLEIMPMLSKVEVHVLQLFVRSYGWSLHAHKHTFLPLYVPIIKRDAA